MGYTSQFLLPMLSSAVITWISSQKPLCVLHHLYFWFSWSIICILASINLLFSLCKICTAAECEGDVLAKVSDISEDFTLVLFLSHSCKTFTFWLIDCILFAVLPLNLKFSVNPIWLPEFKPKLKVLPFSSYSCASITFTLTFALSSYSSSFISFLLFSGRCYRF